MSEINDFMDTAYLDRLQTYCLMRDGTIIESFDDLIARRIELEPYISSFLIEDAKPKERVVVGKTFSLPYWERWAILISLKNSLYRRRKSYVETFCSSIFFSQQQCAEILQSIETTAHFTGDTRILWSNPLVWILGLNEYPYIKWTSLIRTKFCKHIEYVPGEFIEWAFASKDIDINMYHPYVWHLLREKDYSMLKQFTLDWTYTKHLK